jgi:hypothetical protein
MLGPRTSCRTAAVVLVALLGAACSAVAPTSSSRPDAPEAEMAPRVFVEAMLFDAPPHGLGSIVAPSGFASSAPGFGDLPRRAGAHAVVSPHVLVADDESRSVTGFFPPAVPSDAASALLYRLDLKPHVVEAGRVRLDVGFESADKRARTTVVVDDKQLVILGTGLEVSERRVVLLVRPHIVRSDADLQALMNEKLGADRAR